MSKSGSWINNHLFTYTPYTEILWKLLPRAKFHWNRTIGCWVVAKKTTFKTADVRHLEFLKCSYLVIWLSSSYKCAVVYQISSKSADFSLRYGDLTICKIEDSGHLEFSKFRVCHVCHHTILFPCANYRLLSFGQKQFFKWRLSAILNFRDQNGFFEKPMWDLL